MNITVDHSAKLAPRRIQLAPPETAPTSEPNGTPSPVDAFSSGATKGANTANTLIGVWNGGISGAITGGAIGLGTNVVTAIAGAVSGDASIGLGTLIDTATSTGIWALGGGVVGATVGGVVTNKAGKFLGGVGANIARKTGGNENLGRALGTMSAGVALGTIAGAGVAGINGAVVALGAGLAGGGLAYLKS